MYSQNPVLAKTEKSNQQKYTAPTLDSMITRIKDNLIRVFSQAPNHKDILLFRILHYSCAGMFILFYYVYQKSIPDVVDSLTERSILASMSIIITGSSYSSRWIYKHFLRISYLVFFGYNVWILYMLNVNNFASEFVLSYFVLLVGVGTVIQRKEELLIFSVTTLAIYSVLILLNGHPKVNPIMSILILLSLQVFIYTLMKVKLRYLEIIKNKSDLLKKKNEEIIDSLRYAKRIQSAILPSDHLLQEHLKDSFVLYKPKDVVAGDFYWLEQKENKVLFALADCTGHGVPGAMVSVVCHNALNRSVHEFGLTDPGSILDKAREIVMKEFKQSNEEVKDGMDIALVSLTSNKRTTLTSTGSTFILEYAGAHNPLWIIKNSSEEIIEVKADKQPVGLYFAETPFNTRQLELNKGDTVYMFSDGFADQFGGPRNKKFKVKALRKLLLEIQYHPMPNQLKILERVFEDWRGTNEQIDDVCVAGFKV